MRKDASLAGKTIVITGATGFIGRMLMKRLRNERCKLIVLARSPQKATQLYPKEAFRSLKVVKYDSSRRNIDERVLEGVVSEGDAIVNMAGEDISVGRWTNQRKRQLWDSRVVGTRNIARAIHSVGRKNVVFVSMSAVGYYGTSETRKFDEKCAPGNDFLARLANAWEKAAFSFSHEDKRDVRTVVLRMGVVLGKGGGALAKMKPAFELFLGGPPGSGRQKFSWIHADDAINIIIGALMSPKFSGVYNATSPNPVQLNEFCSALGESIGRPSWLPVPSLAVKLAVGNEAARLVLAGQEVLPKRLLESGYSFKYCNVREALKSLNNAGVEVI